MNPVRELVEELAEKGTGFPTEPVFRFDRGTHPEQGEELLLQYIRTIDADIKARALKALRLLEEYNKLGNRAPHNPLASGE